MSSRSFLGLRLCTVVLASALLLLVFGRSLLLVQTRALAQREAGQAVGLKAINSSPTVLGTPTVLSATVEGGESLTLTWSFGDGSSGLGAVVSHTYPAAGEYPAVVTATGAVTQTLSATTTVQVDEPVSGLSITLTGERQAGWPITFTASVTQGSRLTYQWDFGDGIRSTGNPLLHRFPAGGWYTPVVTASNRVSWITATAQVSVSYSAYLPLLVSYWPPVPRPPLLQPISNPDDDLTYSLGWTYPKPLSEITFTLQEAQDPAFSAGLRLACTTRQTSCDVSVAWGGRYYYRVRGENRWGAGPWSLAEDIELKTERVPNDPGYATQWGLRRINAPGAWGMSSGAGVVIAMIDSGIDLQHPDLLGKLWTNPGEIAGNGWDDDGNGLVDDVYGWDYVSQDSQPQDDNGHGTHTSGIAAAATNNGAGVAGIGWDARLMPLKVLDSQGMGYSTDVVAAMYYAVLHGARVINMSLAAEQYIFSLQQATDYAYNRGSLVVAAAGNCGDSGFAWNGCSSPNPVIYPAANPNVLGVAATSESDAGSVFSERGHFIDLAAPGENIYSTFQSGSYRAATGTSMAAPFAAGLAALVWGRNPALTNQQVAVILMHTSADLGTPGRDDLYGYGRIDAREAVAAATNPSIYGLDQVQLAGLEPDTPVQSAGEGLEEGLEEGMEEGLSERPSLSFRPGILILQLRPRVLDTSRESFLAGYGLRPEREFPGMGLVVVQVKAGDELRLAEALSADPAIVFAEPDYQIRMASGSTGGPNPIPLGGASAGRQAGAGECGTPPGRRAGRY